MNKYKLNKYIKKYSIYKEDKSNISKIVKDCENELFCSKKIAEDFVIKEVGSELNKRIYQLNLSNEKNNKNKLIRKYAKNTSLIKKDIISFLINKYHPTQDVVKSWLSYFQGSFFYVSDAKILENSRKLINVDTDKAKILGQGGYGLVWSHVSNRNLVVKEQEIDEDHLNNFIREGIISQFISTRSDFFVKTYYIDFEEHTHRKWWKKFYCYSVMEKYDSDVFNLKTETMNASVLHKYIKQMYISISKLHDMHIVSRDIKPDNFLYSKKQDKIVLSDLGGACFIGNCKGRIYTPGYEYSRIDIVGKIHDIYSFAVSVLELLQIIVYKKRNWEDKHAVEEYQHSKLYKLAKVCYKIYKSSNSDLSEEWEQMGDSLGVQKLPE